MKQKLIWRVSAYSNRAHFSHLTEDDVQEYFLIFDQCYSDRETAHSLLSEVEREMGIAHGISWHLECIPVDDEMITDISLKEIRQALMTV